MELCYVFRTALEFVAFFGQFFYIFLSFQIILDTMSIIVHVIIDNFNNDLLSIIIDILPSF